MDRGSAAPSDVFLQSGPRPTNAWCWSSDVSETMQGVFGISSDAEYSMVSTWQCKGSSGSRVDFFAPLEIFNFTGLKLEVCLLLGFELRFFSGQMLQSEVRISHIFRWSNTFINKNLGSPSNFLTQMSRPKRQTLSWALGKAWKSNV